MARVNETQAETLRRRNTSRGNRIALDTDIAFLALVRHAAEGRGMGVNGYARRAVAAFVAHDLGLPFEEVCSHFASPYRAGQMLRKDDERSVHLRKGPTQDDGKGFGSWKVR